MKIFTKARSILSVALLLGSATLAPAVAQRYLAVPAYAPYPESHLVWANGQAFWSGPSEFGRGRYVSAGELKFDSSRYQHGDSTDPQDYSAVVFHPHSGPFECVWRKRVGGADFEWFHPYVLVCD